MARCALMLGCRILQTMLLEGTEGTMLACDEPNGENTDEDENGEDKACELWIVRYEVEVAMRLAAGCEVCVLRCWRGWREGDC